MPEEANKKEEAVDNRPWLFKYITAITRTWGLVTIIVLWVFAMQSLYETNKKKAYTKWYLVGISPVITLLEFLWLFDKFACCENDQQCCCKTWHAFLWIDGWKKTIIYCALSIPCFLQGIVDVWAVLYGLLLIVLALFYLLKSIKYSSCIEKHRTRPADDPRSSLVRNEARTGVSNNYSSTQSTSGAVSESARPGNPDWPPRGYAEGPDGSLYKVSTKADEESEQTSRKTYLHEETEQTSRKTDQHSSVTPQTGRNNTQQQQKTSPEKDSFEPVASSQWPPPGFATARDGSLYAVTNDSAPVQGRENPFNKTNRNGRAELTESTDSYNPFES